MKPNVSAVPSQKTRNGKEDNKDNVASSHRSSQIQLSEAVNQELLVFALGLTLRFPNSFTEEDIIKNMHLNLQYFYFFIRKQQMEAIVL